MLIEDVSHETLLDHILDGVYFVGASQRVTYWNKGAERITGYLRSEIQDQPASDDRLSHFDSNGNPDSNGERLVELCMTDGQVREKEVYFRHKDGQLVPVFSRVSPITNNQGDIIGALEVFSDNSSKLQAMKRIEELEELALICPLTEIGNRRYAHLALQNAFEEMKRYHSRFGILFIDIDRFKNVNDKYGHPIGDEVLRMVARALKATLRGFDFVGRWGGEEFLIILPNINAEVVIKVAERCRTTIEKSILQSEGQELSVTVSIGGVLACEEDSTESVIDRADQLMYESKRTGRNRVTFQ